MWRVYIRYVDIFVLDKRDFSHGHRHLTRKTDQILLMYDENSIIVTGCIFSVAHVNIGSMSRRTEAKDELLGVRKAKR